MNENGKMTDTMHAPMPSRGEWTASGGSGSMAMDWLDRALAAPASSVRLQQAESSLEAEYAVLSEANAKNAELQAMLRNSQPLLWLDNALVMQRKRSDQAPRKQAGRVGIVKPHLRFVDELPMEMESDLRHRRRVQWEIAKRIARVEREISKQPQGQRSWHVKEKQRAIEEAKKRQEEEKTREKQRREAEVEAVKQRQEIEKRAKAKETQARRVEKTLKQDTVKTAPKIDVDLEFDWPETKKESKVAIPKPTKPVLRALSESDESDEEKENVSVPPVIQLQDSPDLRQHARQETVDQQPQDQALLRIACESFENPTHTSLQEHNEYDSRPAQASESHRNNRGFKSSLGRQVLSEYRTMPTPVSFGALPIITGSQQPKRLNSDVLRRLFSDLDTDRDGHLNRIETCMALHRLQVDVPAPRIVSFFKRIHDVETVTQPQHKRKGQMRVSEPLRQVISYKQFVAFVTAAFEQQQQRQTQRQQRLDPPTRKPLRERPPLDLPLLQILPVLAHSVESSVASPTRTLQPPLEQTGRAIKSGPEEVEVRIVEQTEEPLADRVLRELPDYLVSQALAAADAAAASSRTASMQQVVRRSMEKIAGTDSISDEHVERMAHDLVRSFVAKIAAGKSHGEMEDEDMSGLGRAAAFFESLNRQDDANADAQAASESEAVSEDWWRELTEEQVGSLVQEIWQLRRPTRVQQTVITDDVADILDVPTEESPPPGIADPPSVNVIAPQEEEKALELSGVDTVHVQRIAEKAIQTESHESLPPPPPPPLDVSRPATTVQAELRPPPPPPPSSPPPPKVRSALARAVLQTNPRSARGVPQRNRTVATSMTAAVLADLRRQRRQRQAIILVESMDSTSSHEVASPSAIGLPVTSSSSPHEDIQDPDLRETPPMQAFVPEAAGLDLDSDLRGDDPALLPDVESPPSLPVKEHRLQFAQSPVRSHSAIVRSSLSSSGIFSSESSSGVSSINSFSLFRQFDEQLSWRANESQPRYRPRKSTRRRPNILMDSQESSGGPRSIHDDDSGDLSEGEIARGDDADLSDGELFGATRRKVVRRKNYGVMRDDRMTESLTSPPLDVGGSVESGEMLPSMIHIQRAFHQRLIASSASSLESGEAEDGIAASL